MGIFQKMIQDSSISYINVYVNNDEIKLENCNRSFENRFLKNQRKELFDVENLLGRNILSEILKAKENGEAFYVHKNINIDKILNITIYKYNEHEYYMSIEVKEEFILSALIRKAPILCWLKSPQGNYIDVNDRFLEYFDIEYDEIIGFDDTVLFDYETSKRIIEQDKDVYKNKKIKIYENIFVFDKKNRNYFETAKWVHLDIETDEAIGVMGVSIESVDKVTLRNNIEKNERNFLDITSNLDEVIMIIEKDKATYVSSYFEELFGYKPDELYNKLDNWMNYWDNIEFLTEIKPYENKEVEFSVTKLGRENEEDIYIESKFIPIFDEYGNVIRKIGLTKDITRQITIENELESLRLDFFANLSHEFRTPINLISSTLQLIGPRIKDIECENKHFLEKYINIINQNSLRLLKLVNNLIDTTMIDSGNFSYNPRNYDIVSFVEDICDSLVDFVKLHNRELIFDTNKEEHVNKFDLDHIERVVLNLVSNSVKYSDPYTKIEVTLEIDEDVVIKIKDYGPGIPKDRQKIIFKRFGQAKDKMRNGQEGSGIGLFIVKSLINMNNGDIKVNSSFNKGSEFIITLPNEKIPKEEYNLIDNNLIIENNSNIINKVNIEFSDIYK